jgi:ATP-independent RNA helicase DbpA
MKHQNYSADSILKQLGIKALNPMQEAAIGAASGGESDLMLLSPTGSGKTLAFLIPILQGLDAAVTTTQALIVVPSRELAQQIEQVFRSMGTGIKITAGYGGHLRETEENNLIQPPAIIVGTPGRLCDHIRRGNITSHSITTLVLDEYDKTLELGFEEEMSFIVSSMPAVQRRILTSATQAPLLIDVLKLNNLITLDFLPTDEVPAHRLEVKVTHSTDRDKSDTLFHLLCTLGNRSTIIFCNHREAVERTAKLLSEKGIVSTFYHGGMEQQQRDAALCKFRNGTVNFLVTTDLAARGLDIPNIRYIIHYHLPENEESYTHRNGRTARMDASGTAIMLLGPEESLPEYITSEVAELEPDHEAALPEAPQWVTLFIAAGKKDKVNKVDIVGFMAQKGALKKEDIGLIEVKDFFSFVAIRKSKATHALHLIRNEKIKNKKVMIATAK